MTADGGVTACPECGGPQLADHPKGVLTFDHDRAACSLGRAEDSTAEADQRRTAGWHGPVARLTTEAEKTLLGAVGIDPTTVDYTTVTPITPSVIRRTWTHKERA